LIKKPTSPVSSFVFIHESNRSLSMLWLGFRKPNPLILFFTKIDLIICSLEAEFVEIIILSFFTKSSIKSSKSKSHIYTLSKDFSLFASQTASHELFAFGVYIGLKCGI
jgi:hypothetical protein